MGVAERIEAPQAEIRAEMMLITRIHMDNPRKSIASVFKIRTSERYLNNVSTRNPPGSGGNIQQHEIELLKAEQDSLKNERWRLLNDPDYIEKLAREKYGMQRDDETVYKFYDENTGSSSENE